MKEYMVTFDITGAVNVLVSARDEEDAIAKAEVKLGDFYFGDFEPMEYDFSYIEEGYYGDE